MISKRSYWKKARMAGHFYAESQIHSEQETMTGKRLIIGFGHKARQGKDTAASHLQELFECRVVHFADALYEECRHATILYKEDTSQLYCKTGNEDFFSYGRPEKTIAAWIKDNGEKRPGIPFDADYFYGGMKEKDAALLQFWGTEFRRKKFHWNYWIDKVREEIHEHPEDDFLIPDTRFKNEAEMIRKMGGHVWKIDRPGYQVTDRDPNHLSEIDLQDWDFDAVFQNNSTIGDLQQKVELHFRKLKGLYDE